MLENTPNLSLSLSLSLSLGESTRLSRASQNRASMSAVARVFPDAYSNLPIPRDPPLALAARSRSALARNVRFVVADLRHALPFLLLLFLLLRAFARENVREGTPLRTRARGRRRP